MSLPSAANTGSARAWSTTTVFGSSGFHTQGSVTKVMSSGRMLTRLVPSARMPFVSAIASSVAIDLDDSLRPATRAEDR